MYPIKHHLQDTGPQVRSGVQRVKGPGNNGIAYYPIRVGESSDTTCVSEGPVGQSHSMRCWRTGLSGRKQAWQRVIRGIGWL